MKRAALKGSLVVLILSLFIVSLSKYSNLLDTRTLITHLSSLGFPLLIVLLPYVLIMLSDTCGWRIAFGNAATQAAAGKLLMIRIATETLQVSLPGGDFLGYEPPCLKRNTLGEKLLQYLYLKGVCQKELAWKIRIAPTTLSRVERDRGSCFPSVLRKVERFPP